MGCIRALYVLCFPLVLTAAGFVLSLITFFSGYEHALGLKNVHYMSLDFRNASYEGVTASSLLGNSNVSDVYTISTNGWCSGSSNGSLTNCSTPVEPFYFNIEELLKEVGLSNVEDALPDSVTKYNGVSKGATYAIWACFLAAIILSFFQFVFGFFGMCSIISGRVASFLSSLSFIVSGIGAGLATGVYYIYTKKINDAVDSFGAKATLDHSGLGFAWATAVALLIASILFSLSCCCSTSRTKYVTVPEKADYRY